VSVKPTNRASAASDAMAFAACVEAASGIIAGSVTRHVLVVVGTESPAGSRLRGFSFWGSHPTS